MVAAIDVVSGEASSSRALTRMVKLQVRVVGLGLVVVSSASVDKSTMG